MPRIVNFKDRAGQTFGRLTVKSLHHKEGKPHYKTFWNCVCACGSKCVVRANSLTKGTTQSCGCLKKETAAALKFSHGMNRSPEHRAWKQMKTRCLNENSTFYARYGGRGIKIHPEWVNDFKKFFAYVGPKPSPRYSINRIDNNGDYAPGNVMWATGEEQGQNTSTTKLNACKVKTIRESALPTRELASAFSVSRTTIQIVRRGGTWKNV
jgi:hypothetical protein